MLLRKAFAEFLGVFMLVFFGCGAIMLRSLNPELLHPACIPIIFGGVISIAIYAFGHLSGAHLNPAVTLAFAAARHFPAREVAAYWTAQITGAVLASALLGHLLPDAGAFGATVPSIPIGQSLLWEVLLTFFLMVVVMSVATDTRAEGTMAGIAIGLYVMLAAFIGGPFTGASMNPARSLGPAWFDEHQLSDIWIYLIGPATGALLGALTYQWLRCEKESTEKPAKGCC